MCFKLTTRRFFSYHIFPGITPLYGLYRYVRPQRTWFLTVLVINRVLILAIVVKNRVCFLHSNLELVMFLRRS